MHQFNPNSLIPPIPPIPFNPMQMKPPQMTAKQPLAPTRSRTRKRNSAAKNQNWTDEEDKLLMELFSKTAEPNWEEIAKNFTNKTIHQITDRWAKVLNPSLVKGSWKGEEDALILKWVSEHGAKDWANLAEMLPGRISKQCRERWHNHLSPNVLKSDWTEWEDSVLIEKQRQLGNKWSKIAMFLPGRTDNAVKNRWNSSLKRKLDRIEKGLNPSGRRGRKPKKQSDAPVKAEVDIPKPNLDDLKYLPKPPIQNTLTCEMKTPDVKTSPIKNPAENTLGNISPFQLSPTLPSPNFTSPLSNSSKVQLQCFMSPGWGGTPNQLSWNILSPFSSTNVDGSFDKNDLSNIPGPKLD